MTQGSPAGARRVSKDPHTNNSLAQIVVGRMAGSTTHLGDKGMRSSAIMTNTFHQLGGSQLESSVVSRTQANSVGPSMSSPNERARGSDAVSVKKGVADYLISRETRITCS